MAAWHGLQGATVVAVTSGANINFDRLRLVSELADIGALREAMLATTIPEQPGAFLRFIQTALDPVPDIQVTEFKYRCADAAWLRVTNVATVLASVASNYTNLQLSDGAALGRVRCKQQVLPAVRARQMSVLLSFLRQVFSGRRGTCALQRRCRRLDGPARSAAAHERRRHADTRHQRHRGGAGGCCAGAQACSIAEWR